MLIIVLLQLQQLSWWLTTRITITQRYLRHIVTTIIIPFSISIITIKIIVSIINPLLLLWVQSLLLLLLLLVALFNYTIITHHHHLSMSWRSYTATHQQAICLVTHTQTVLLCQYVTVIIIVVVVMDSWYISWWSLLLLILLIKRILFLLIKMLLLFHCYCPVTL